MERLCDCFKLTSLTLEADMGADPLWCSVCGYNLDLYDLALDTSLEQRLMTWVNAFGSWVDWETERVLPNEEGLEINHNQTGAQLLPQIQEAFGESISVTFKPSKMY